MLQNIEDIIYYKFESFTKKLQLNKTEKDLLKKIYFIYRVYWIK